ncbi:DUF1330 domain-containing protein [Magnetovibrio sp. PR-2]|uniref:DUF1330 domain-containing protein n=1 Tax=Magnetovibrio sp. PR-2 TaxID=3120356 RepID=UPI002FCE3017
MDNKTTLVVTATPDPDEMATVQEYLRGVMPLLQGAGGQLIKRLKASQGIHGKTAAMVLVMDFSSASAISDMFASDEYAALVPVRDKGFVDMNIQLSQEM